MKLPLTNLKTSSKVCTKCGVRKDLTKFYNNCRGKFGKAAICIDCDRKKGSLWQKNNPLKVSLKSERWRKNPQSGYHNYLTNNREAYQLAYYGKILDPIDMQHDRFRVARADGLRSGLEVKITRELDSKGVSYTYEQFAFPYTVPEEVHTYTPDIFLSNGIIVELKGEWITADRKKVRLFREQYPDIEYRMVFSRASQRISKQSKTTYQMMCERMGILCASGSIPDSWLQEPHNQKSLDAIKAAAR